MTDRSTWCSNSSTESLRQLIAEGPIGWERAVAIARQVASALGAAHAASIVHRDLKPDNVMLVTQPDGTERVKVLDFGIARVTLSEPQRDATHLTKVGAVMGTVAYMSPEQALGEEVDERTDLYALGVILHEMITGRAPFDADTAAQILAKQITETPPPLPPGTPAALGALVAELLRKTRIERPPSARVVLERLEGLKLGSAPAVVTQTSDPRQRRLLFAGIGVAAAAVGIVGAVALSGGDERTVSPETVASSAASGVTASSGTPGARGDEIGPKEPEETDVEDAGVARSKSSTSESKPAPSAGTASKSGKRRTQGSDSGKKRKGPGGIYIPPPSEWF
jgi:serine/threonine protein kinase